MDMKLKVLRILSNMKDRNWKIGQTDEYINAFTSRITSLPQNVFDTFPINADPSKKISTVDFVLMTYDMRVEDRENLMQVYGIEHKTVATILRIADEIADTIEFEQESFLKRTSTRTPVSPVKTHISKKDSLFDEIPF